MMQKIFKIGIFSILIFSLIACGGSDTKLEPNMETMGNETENSNSEDDRRISNDVVIDETPINETENNNPKDDISSDVVIDETPINEISLKHNFLSYNLDELTLKVTLSNDGRRLYLIQGFYGFMIINIEDVNNVFIEGKYQQNDGSRIDNLIPSKNGKFLYLAMTNGIHILDSSNLDNIVEVGKFANEFIEKIILNKEETILYVSGQDDLKAGEFTPSTGLLTLDVSNPRKITKLNFYENSFTKDLSLSSDEKYMYLAGESVFSAGLTILDMSNPRKPKLVSKIANNINNTVYKILLSKDGKRAYLAQDEETSVAGVEIADYFLTTINIENPLKPKVLSRSKRYFSASKNIAMKFSLDEKKIYLGAGDRGLGVMEVGATNVLTKGILETNSLIFDFALSKDNKLAYIVTIDKNFIIMTLE